MDQAPGWSPPHPAARQQPGLSRDLREVATWSGEASGDHETRGRALAADGLPPDAPDHRAGGPLRLAAALYLGDRVEPFSGAFDQVSYDTLARRLLGGHGLTFPTAWCPFSQADQPTAHWSYLYTLYLAAVYAVFGPHPLAARLIQALLGGVLLPWFVYRLTWRALVSPREIASGGASPPQGMLPAGSGRAAGGRGHPISQGPQSSLGMSGAHGESPTVSAPGTRAATGGHAPPLVVAHRAALAAAAIAAVYAYFVLFSASLMTQTFYMLALLVALERALAIAQSGTGASTGRDWLVLGLALGFGTLLRQTLLLFVPILLAWLWWSLRPATPDGCRDRPMASSAKERHSPGPTSLEAARPAQSAPSSRLAAFRASGMWNLLVPVVVVALFVSPWTLYNYHRFGQFLLLNSNGGYWLYASNHPSRGTHFDGNEAPPIPEELRGLNEAALDRELFRRGLQSIVAGPRRFLLLSFDRLRSYFWLAPSVRSSPASNLGRLLAFGAFLPFMLRGLWLSRRFWRSCLPLYLYVGFDGLLHLISWAAPRYRLPSDAVLLAFAGLALVAVGRPAAAILQRTSGTILANSSGSSAGP